MDNAKALYILWSDIDVSRSGYHEFQVLWSDHTWEDVRIPIGDVYVNVNFQGLKRVRELLRLQNVVHKKMTRAEVKNYIMGKLEEYDLIRFMHGDINI